MTPTDAIGEDVRLWRGDCLPVLRGMADASVDHVITDPPFSEVTHRGARTRVLTGRDVYAEFGGSGPVVNFDSMTDADFVSMCRILTRLARRWVVVSCDWRHASAVERELPDHFIRLGIWDKPDGAPQFSGDRPGTGWEAVLLLHRPGKKRWNGGGTRAVWTCNVVKTGNVHPTQKPIPLLRQWVRLFTDPGDTILDPFLGSGTTGVAALREGRKFIGIEKDPTHYQTALSRLRHAAGESPDQLFGVLEKST